MTLAAYTPDRMAAAGRFELSDRLEAGEIVYFPTCPLPLPAAADMAFLREELPRLLRLKNVSYHPEVGHVRGIDGDPATVERVSQILVEHSDAVRSFLARAIPSLTRDWLMGTCSFRPIEERGRDLKPHASNELVHFDAGAYGATNGDRILRFFVNINPDAERVWATKGTFPELFARYGDRAGVRAPAPGPRYLRKGPLDHARTLLIRALTATGLPLARVLDSSPYDRVMRRFHNFMKDTPDFQADPLGHEELRFPPYSAWMVFTDMVSHASVSGQYAFVTTGLVPLANCRRPELAPINIMRAA
jgi:hypothetical protein